MRVQFSSYYAVIAVILTVVVVSGPIAPQIDFTPSSDQIESTQGPSNASITVLTVPSDGYRIIPKRYDDDPEFRIPSAVVHVIDVSANPTLIYEVSIPALGYSAAELYFITEANEGHNLSLDTANRTIERQDLTRESYLAQVNIRVRGTDGVTVLHTSNVTVQVEVTDEG